MIISQHLFCDDCYGQLKQNIQRTGLNQKHHVDSLDNLSGAMEPLFFALLGK
jgi:hypothetical protein